MTPFFVYFTAGLAVLSAAMAQAPQPPRPAPAIVSPEIHPDGRVTFRLLAPQAREVAVAGAWMSRGQSPTPMTKDDQGVWSATLGPVPHVTDYTFRIDGVSALDPRNPRVKRSPTSPGYSLIFVPSNPPALWDVRDVPHGMIHQLWYRSPVAGDTRRMQVYTPPGYDPAGKNRYPGLYLLHRGGDDDEAWTATGQANVVLDNLLAEGKIKAMIVVMPVGHVRPPGVTGNTGYAEHFTRELVEAIVPTAEKTFRLDADRTHRAMAGLSMGGGQTLNAGLSNLDRFAYLGVFSMGTRDAAAFEKQHAKVLNDAAGTNKKLKVFYMACGENDFLWDSVLTLDGVLTRKNIKHTFQKSGGAHEWVNWVDYLMEFSLQLFR